MPFFRPKITLVVYDLAKNCFGRAYLLGKMLEPDFEIEIAGFASGPTWKPCADHNWPEVSLSWPAPDNYRDSICKLASQTSGDIVIGCKAWPTVLDIGDAIIRLREVERILDIDDWEFGWCHPLRLRKILSLVLRSKNDPNGFVRLWWAEKRALSWPTRLVSSRFLQNRFGGIYTPHACDTGSLDPDKSLSKVEARVKFGLPPERLLAGFVGSPKPHKGLDVMAEAVTMLKNDNISILVAGADEDDPGIASLKSVLADRISVLPVFPKSDLGNVLAALDMVVLPQRDTPACHAQVPAKVFDAMAMRLPVIASDISDLPEILEGCGVTVTPDDPGKLAEAIDGLAADPQKRQAMGEAARRKCVATYSFERVGKELRKLIWERFEKHGRRGSGYRI